MFNFLLVFFVGRWLEGAPSVSREAFLNSVMNSLKTPAVGAGGDSATFRDD
jgi:hypothetical protein